MLEEAKGQKISRAIYGVLNSSKKSSQVKLFSFLEELRTPLICFRDFLTFTTNVPVHTGKSVSEAHILESVNPQYDDRLFRSIYLYSLKN